MKTRIVWDSDWQEYVVKVWDDNGKRLHDSDYHTDDREDAQQTAREIEQGNAQ